MNRCHALTLKNNQCLNTSSCDNLCSLHHYQSINNKIIKRISIDNNSIDIYCSALTRKGIKCKLTESIKGSKLCWRHTSHDHSPTNNQISKDHCKALNRNGNKLVKCGKITEENSKDHSYCSEHMNNID